MDYYLFFFLILILFDITYYIIAFLDFLPTKVISIPNYYRDICSFIENSSLILIIISTIIFKSSK